MKLTFYDEAKNMTNKNMNNKTRDETTTKIVKM